jgi:hypothetical protein
VAAVVVVETTISLAAHLAVEEVVALPSSSIRAKTRPPAKSTAEPPESRVQAVVRLALIVDQTAPQQCFLSPARRRLMPWEEAVAVAHTRVAKLVIRVAVAAAVVLSTVAQPRLGEQRIRVAARTEALATQVVQAAVAA